MLTFQLIQRFHETFGFNFSYAKFLQMFLSTNTHNRAIKQASKQPNKQASNQTSKQINKSKINNTYLNLSNKRQIFEIIDTQMLQRINSKNQTVCFQPIINISLQLCFCFTFFSNVLLIGKCRHTRTNIHCSKLDNWIETTTYKHNNHNWNYVSDRENNLVWK